MPAEMHRQGGRGRDPVAFLFGFERSGTTLLSMVVGAHPRIAVPLSVTGMWYRYGRALAEYDHLRSQAGLERLVDDLLRHERIRMWDEHFTRAEVLEGLAPGNFAAVVACLHSLYARHKGKELWANIDIGTLDDMDVANQWFPRARFVHIVRDGRDVALSHRTYEFGTTNTLDCARRWVAKIHANLKMGAILGPKRYLIVRYEDLILHTEAALRRLCDFMDVEYSPRMLDYSEMVDEKIPPQRRHLWPLLSKPPSADPVYRWKRTMPETERMVFERSARDVLITLGYDMYPELPRTLRANALELWYFLDQGQRFGRLASKLGLRRR